MQGSSIILYAVWITNIFTYSTNTNSILITGTNLSPSGVVIIPAGVTGIQSNAFVHCNSLTNINIASSVTSIGTGAFSNDMALSNISFTTGLLNIGVSAFQGCPLYTFTLPPTVTNISAYAFSVGGNYSSVSIPSSVISIGSYAFSYNAPLGSATFVSANCTFADNTVFYNDTTFMTIYAPAGGTVQTYCTSIGKTFN